MVNLLMQAAPVQGLLNTPVGKDVRQAYDRGGMGDVLSYFAGPHLTQGVRNLGQTFGLAGQFTGAQDVRDYVDYAGPAVSAAFSGDLESAGRYALPAAAAMGSMMLPWVGGLGRQVAGAMNMPPVQAPTPTQMPGVLAREGEGDVPSPDVTQAEKFGMLRPSSGGRSPLPSDVSSDVSQPLLSYPPVPPPVMAHESKKKIFGPRDEPYEEGTFNKVWTGKGTNKEVKALQKFLAAAQRDIDAGNYTPYFDVAKRSDVDPSKYPDRVLTTDVAVPKKPETIAKYQDQASQKESIKRLNKAYDLGLTIDDSENWYFVAQLEKKFIEVLGAKEGRKAFREKIAKQMAATTGGSSPKENLRTAMYANYLTENKLPWPHTSQRYNFTERQSPDDMASYNMPFPVGGRYVGGNVKMAKKLTGQDIDPANNPKRYDFEGNFLGDARGATIDEQMSGLWDPSMRLPPGDSYGIYEGVLAGQAKKRGVDPRGFQDVAWAGAKKGKEGDKYPGSKPMIQEFNEMIERTSRATGLTPEEVVVEGFIRSRVPLLGLGGAAFLGAEMMQAPADEYGT